MPTLAQLKQFLIGAVIPPVAGALATWIVGTHVLDLFQVSKGQVVYELTQVLTFAVVSVLAWLSAHHMLKGTYTNPVG